MPTNLPPQANSAWERYQDARTTSEKIKYLEEYLSLIPKHKGAENLVRQVKTKLSKLREQKRKEREKRKGTGERWLIPKEGDVQVVLVGTPSSGKTAILNHLTGSKYDEGEFPFTTTECQVGVGKAKGAQLQIVELPAIIEGSSKGLADGNRVIAGVRNADLVVLTMDISQDPIAQLDIIIGELYASQIRLNEAEPPVMVEKTGSGGRQVFQGDQFVDGGKKAVLEFLEERSIVNAVVKFKEPTTLEDLLDVMDASVVRKKSMILATKGDLPKSKAYFNKLNNYLKENSLKFNVTPISTKVPEKSNFDKDNILEKFFKELDMIRIYTKNESGIVAEKPVVVKKPVTVRQIVEIISKKMLKHFRFARVWGESIKFDGERVGLDHNLKDGDHLQIFA